MKTFGMLAISLLLKGRFIAEIAEIVPNEMPYP
jgi:hypothetical protein